MENTVGGTDTIGHGSVQAWSAGEIFPATISVVESYTDAGELRWTAFELTLDGRTERYATYDDARMVARALLSSPEQRAMWRV